MKKSHIIGTAMLLVLVFCSARCDGGAEITVDRPIIQEVVDVAFLTERRDSICRQLNLYASSLKVLAGAQHAETLVHSFYSTKNGNTNYYTITFDDGNDVLLSVNTEKDFGVKFPVLSIGRSGNSKDWFWRLNGAPIYDSNGAAIPVLGNEPPTFFAADETYYMIILGKSRAVGVSDGKSPLCPFSSVKMDGERRVIVTKCDGGDVAIPENAVLAEEIVTKKLRTAETDGTPLNFIVMGDGYTQAQIDDGTYDSAMEKVVDTFFEIEPYKSLEKLFNCYSVQLVSKTNGFGEGKETALSCNYASSGDGITGNFDKAFNYAVSIPEIRPKAEPDNMVLVNGILYSDFKRVKGGLVVVVLMNSSRSKRAGICHMLGTGMCVAALDRCPSEDDFKFVLWHEAGGHGFAYLADEYQGAYDRMGSGFAESIRACHEQDLYPNIDGTSDPEKVSWAHLLKDPRYQGHVKVIEGGYNYNYGVWRSSENSLMRYRDSYTPPYFNAVSREAIYKTAMKLNRGNGYVYDFEEFATFDEPTRTELDKYKPL